MDGRHIIGPYFVRTKASDAENGRFIRRGLRVRVSSCVRTHPNNQSKCIKLLYFTYLACGYFQTGFAASQQQFFAAVAFISNRIFFRIINLLLVNFQCESGLFSMGLKKF